VGFISYTWTFISASKQASSMASVCIAMCSNKWGLAIDRILILLLVLTPCTLIIGHLWTPARVVAGRSSQENMHAFLSTQLWHSPKTPTIPRCSCHSIVQTSPDPHWYLPWIIKSLHAFTIYFQIWNLNNLIKLQTSKFLQSKLKLHIISTLTNSPTRMLQQEFQMTINILTLPT
jgi:hypothetical protein